MSQIRVFVVDDSVVYRKLLLTTINSIPGVRTVGVASNGKEALDAIPLVKPDIVTLDLNMPVMDGLETLRQLHTIYPKSRVIMVSSYTTDGAQATLNALDAGALDFITKPDSNDESVNSKLLHDQFVSLLSRYADSEIHQDLAPKKKYVMQERVYKKVKIDHPHLSFVIRPEVVAIGSSTGGPSALTELLPLFPADFPLPILIVQHMPRLFTKTLADSLARKSHLQIVEAQDGMIVKPGTVFIAPGGFQMKIVRRDRGQVTVQITDDPPENHCKPSADYLFRSVAQIYQDKAIGVILTGMGSDGTLGLRLMKRLGAQIIGQNRETCVVWGMPRAAIEAGVVDIELPLHRIAPELIRCAGEKR